MRFVLGLVRVTCRKAHLEQIWSALPQIADIDFSHDDFSGSKRRSRPAQLLVYSAPETYLTAPECLPSDQVFDERVSCERVVFQWTPMRAWVLPHADLRFSRAPGGRLQNSPSKAALRGSQGRVFITGNEAAHRAHSRTPAIRQASI